MALWEWVPRSVERKVRAIFVKHAFVLHVQGRRRIGKSSTVRRVASELQRLFLFVTTGGNIVESFKNAIKDHGREPAEADSPELREILAKGQLAEDNWDAMDIIRRIIELGGIVILDEIQRAETSFQVLLQAFIDSMQYKTLQKRSATANWGGLVFMGSEPTRVLEVLEGSHRPLYHRVTERVHIFPFLPHELQAMFEMHSIESSQTKVMLYTLCGGVPLLYQHLCKDGRLHNAVHADEVLHSLYGGSSPFGNDVANFYERELDAQESRIVRQVYRKPMSTLSDVASAVGKKPEDVRQIMNRLLEQNLVCSLYPISYSVATMSSQNYHERFRVSDNPICAFRTLYEEFGRQAMVASQPDPPMVDMSTLQTLEGAAFERWIPSIISDRPTESQSSPFPAYNYKGELMPVREQPRICVGTDVEIDLILVFLLHKTVVFGSSKRTYTYQSHADLHKKAAQFRRKIKDARASGCNSSAPKYADVLESYMIDESWTTLFVYISPEWPTDARQAFYATVNSVSPPENVFISDLSDLIGSNTRAQ